MRGIFNTNKYALGKAIYASFDWIIMNESIEPSECLAHWAIMAIMGSERN